MYLLGQVIQCALPGGLSLQDFSTFTRIGKGEKALDDDSLNPLEREVLIAMGADTWRMKDLTRHLEKDIPHPSDVNQDGILTMAEIFGLSFNADFIALSACNTGRQDASGNITRGEGARGLTRSFMYAGTPAVSVTLWSVESNSSKIMDAAFFGYMNGGMSRAGALRKIKLEMMNGEYGELYRHPYYWSPLVMFGDAN